MSPRHPSTLRKFCTWGFTHERSPLWETQSSRARAELAQRIYGPELLEAFRAFEQIWHSPATNPPSTISAPVAHDTPARTNTVHPGTSSAPATDCMGLRCVVLV